MKKKKQKKKKCLDEDEDEDEVVYNGNYSLVIITCKLAPFITC